MSEVMQTRALHRALDILDALGKDPATLHELHLRTGHSKTTLRRLLATLVARRYVRQGLSDSVYRTNVAVPGTMESDLVLRVGRLVEVARPYMLELTKRVKWPSDLHVYHSGRMHILESTHGLSPFNSARHFDSNTQLNMFIAASGLAYLAALDDGEVEAISEMMKDDDNWSPARYGVTAVMLRSFCEEVRLKGYATRRASQRTPEGRNAIALPLFEGNRPSAAITIVWRTGHMSPEEFAKMHLPDLKAAATAISAKLI